MTLPWPTTNPAPCSICGSQRDSDAAHTIPRSQGGTETLPLCRACHEATEKGNLWDWEVTPEVLRVVVHLTGEVIMERLTPPVDWDQGQYVEAITEGPEHLISMAELVKYLDNDGLIAVAEAVSVQHTKAGWIYLTEVAYWMHRRLPRGQVTEKTKAIAEAAGMGYRRMMDLLRIRETYDMKALSQSPVAEVEFFAIASRAADPEAALAHIEERKLENPNFSTRQAASEIATREAIAGGRELERAITLLRTARGIVADVEELLGPLAPPDEERYNKLLDTIAELAHAMYEHLWKIADRASPERKALPTIEEISGSDPDLTGGLSTEEYLKRIREDPRETG